MTQRAGQIGIKEGRSTAQGGSQEGIKDGRTEGEAKAVRKALKKASTPVRGASTSTGLRTSGPRSALDEAGREACHQDQVLRRWDCTAWD